MLPTSSTFTPALRRISPSIPTVVVLPFVPVTVNHGRPAVRPLLLETQASFHLSPQVDTRHPHRHGIPGVVRGHARRHDDEVGARLDDRVDEGVRILLNTDLNLSDIIEEQRLSTARIKRAHLPVAGEQRARRTLTRLTPTNNSSETTHRRDTHSA